MLQIKNVHKYYQKKHVLDDVGFDIDDGKVCALLGLNGAGKSTLMKIICGLAFCDSGTVCLNGADVAQCKNIGFMIEDSCFYADMSGLDNLLTLSALYEGVDRKRVLVLLHTVGLIDAADVKFKNYSLGMKQRLYFAYAMLNEPSLLVLDEPFNGIDIVTTRLFKSIIADLKQKGCTILISSHSIDDIKLLCDKMVVLDKGKVVYDKDISLSDNLEDIYVSLVSQEGSAQ